MQTNTLQGLPCVRVLTMCGYTRENVRFERGRPTKMCCSQGCEGGWQADHHPNFICCAAKVFTWLRHCGKDARTKFHHECESLRGQDATSRSTPKRTASNSAFACSNAPLVTRSSTIDQRAILLSTTNTTDMQETPRGQRQSLGSFAEKWASSERLMDKPLAVAWDPAQNNLRRPLACRAVRMPTFGSI